MYVRRESDEAAERAVWDMPAGEGKGVGGMGEEYGLLRVQRIEYRIALREDGGRNM